MGGPVIAAARCLFALVLARGVTRVAGGLALGFQRSLACCGFFLLARGLRRGLCGLFGLAQLLRRFFGLASFLGLGALDGHGLAFGLSLLDRGIIGTRLGLKLGDDIFPGFDRRFLAICETGLLESTHLKTPCCFMSGG